MEYSFEYINKNLQESCIDYTLVIFGKIDDEVIEHYRIEKSFNLKEYVVDKQFLKSEADIEIERIVLEKLNPEEVA